MKKDGLIEIETIFCKEFDAIHVKRLFHHYKWMPNVILIKNKLYYKQL